MNTCRTLLRLVCVVMLSGLGFAGIAVGQADQPTLDELLDLPSGEPVKVETDSDTSTAPDRDESLNESIGDAISASDAADAFEQAVGEMDLVSRRLGRSLDPGIETQRMQESILRKLDQVIKAAKQESSGGGGGGSGEPQEQDQGGEQLAQQDGKASGGEPTGSGQQPSTGAAGTGSPIDPENQDSAIEQLRKEWGVLPPRVREELSDGLRERFSPLYRRLTEAYYKALAEQE
jgi:hypothetical protein